MRLIVFISIILSLLLVLFSSCGGGGSGINDMGNRGFGQISIKINWPIMKELKNNVIPQNTEYISLKVEGEGLKNPLEVNLQKGECEFLFSSVPAGNKRVTAKACKEGGEVRIAEW